MPMDGVGLVGTGFALKLTRMDLKLPSKTMKGSEGRAGRCRPSPIHLVLLPVLFLSASSLARADRIDVLSGRMTVNSGGSVAIGTSGLAGNVNVGKTSSLTVGNTERGVVELVPTGSANPTLRMGHGGTFTVNPTGTFRVTRASGVAGKAVLQGYTAGTSTYDVVLKGALDLTGGTPSSDVYSIEDLKIDGVQVYHGAAIVGMDFGTVKRTVSANGPLLNFSPTGTQSNWPNGSDRDAFPAVITGVTFTCASANWTSVVKEDNLNGSANVKTSPLTPMLHLNAYRGNLTNTTDTSGAGTQTGGMLHALDYGKRLIWDRQASESAGVAKIGSTYYNSLQDAVNSAADGDVIQATTRQPVSENVRRTGNNNIRLEGFVLAPRTGLAVEDTGTAGNVTLRNTVVAAGGVQGGSRNVICENCTIFQYGPSFWEDFPGSAFDTGVWAATQNSGNVSVAGGKLSLAIGSSATSPVVECVQNPFPSVGGMTIDVKLAYTSVVARGNGIRVYSTGYATGTPLIEIWRDSTTYSVTIDGTAVGTSDTNTARVKIFWDGTGGANNWTVWRFNSSDTLLNSGSTTGPNARPNYLAIGDTTTQGAADWTDFDVDWIRVTPLPAVVNAALTDTIQEIGDSGTTAVSGSNLSLRRADGLDRGDGKSVFMGLALMDYHLRPHPTPASAPAWYPIDHGTAQGGYSTEFDDDPNISTPRPYDAGSYAGEPGGNWDIGADEFRNDAPGGNAPVWTYGGDTAQNETNMGPVRAMSFISSRSAAPSALYAYVPTGGGSSNPDLDNTLRLFKFNGSTSTEIAAKRLALPGIPLNVTFIRVSATDCRIYVVLDYDKDGRGDAICAAWDNGDDTTPFKLLGEAGTPVDFGTGDAGKNNFGTLDGGTDDAANVPTTGVRTFGPGRITRVLALTFSGKTPPYRLYFVTEQDGIAQTHCFYALNAETGQTLWVKNSDDYDYRPAPVIVNATTSQMYVGLRGGAGNGTNDLACIDHLNDDIASPPVAAPSTIQIQALPGTDTPSGSAADGVPFHVMTQFNPAVPADSELYVASGNTSRMYRLNANDLSLYTGWSTDPDGVGGSSTPVNGASVVLDANGSPPALTSSFPAIIRGSNYAFISVGTKLHRVRRDIGRKLSTDAVGSTAYTDSGDWPMSLKGALNTLMSFGQSGNFTRVDYFGTDAGEMFAVTDFDANDGTAGKDGTTGIVPGWPYLAPGQRIIECRIAFNFVYFGTDQGYVYVFPKQ